MKIIIYGIFFYFFIVALLAIRLNTGDVGPDCSDYYKEITQEFVKCTSESQKQTEEYCLEIYKQKEVSLIQHCGAE